MISKADPTSMAFLTSSPPHTLYPSMHREGLSLFPPEDMTYWHISVSSAFSDSRFSIMRSSTWESSSAMQECHCWVIGVESR